MNVFGDSLIVENHDYIDYNYLLSVAGIPYLVKTYGYPCFVRALHKAEKEHDRIHPLLREYFTFNERIEQVNLISVEETRRHSQLFLKSRER